MPKPKLPKYTYTVTIRRLKDGVQDNELTLPLSPRGFIRFREWPDGSRRRAVKLVGDFPSLLHTVGMSTVPYMSTYELYNELAIMPKVERPLTAEEEAAEDAEMRAQMDATFAKAFGVRVEDLPPLP